MDLAFTDRKNSDFTAYALCAMDTEGNFCVLHVERHKFQAPQTKVLIKDKLSLVDAPFLIETNGAQIAIYQDIKSDPELINSDIIPVNSTTSKTSRSVGLACALNAGRVKFKKASWNQMVMDEMSEFTLDDSHEHDDMIDAIVMCYNELKYGKASGAMVYGI
jgi:predicted phage terminase large subunit-like protein